MRVLISGGRDFSDRALLFRTLDRIHALKPITVLIHGAARGADSIGDEWARLRGVTPEPYPVTPEEWTFYGKRAGHRRNAQMLEAGPRLLVAFPTGGPGTRNMIQQAKEAGLPLWVVRSARKEAA